MKEQDENSDSNPLIPNFDNRLNSQIVFREDSETGVLDNLDGLPTFPTKLDDGRAYGFKPVNSPSTDMDLQVQGIEQEPLILNYLEEKEEEVAVFDPEGNTKEEPVSKVVSITIYVVDEYVILESSSEISTSKVVSVLRDSIGLEIEEVQFPPEFCSWLKYAGGEGKELFEHLEIQRLRYATYKGGESIEDQVRVEGDPSASESIVAEVADRDLISLRADFEVYGYSVMSQIRSYGRLTVSVQESRTDLNSSQRLLIALSFIVEFCNYFFTWKKDKTTPPDSVTAKSLRESIDITGSPKKVQSQDSNDQLSVRTNSEFWRKSPKDLIDDGESELIEFKDARCSDEKIVKELVALANKRGGALLLGVSDDGSIGGIDDIGRREMDIQNRLDTTVSPRIACEIEFEQVEQSQILVFRIGRYTELPHSVSGTFYTRRGTTKRKLTPYELSYLMPNRSDDQQY